jgi:hypothetical protein
VLPLNADGINAVKAVCVEFNTVRVSPASFGPRVPVATDTVTSAPGRRLFAPVTVRVVLEAERADTVTDCTAPSAGTGKETGIYRTAMPTSPVVVVPVFVVANVNELELAVRIVTTCPLKSAESVPVLPRNVTCWPGEKLLVAVQVQVPAETAKPVV